MGWRDTKKSFAADVLVAPDLSALNLLRDRNRGKSVNRAWLCGGNDGHKEMEKPILMQ